ncbi:VOC family protein [Mucilaginibacter sp. UC70_90]
MLKLNRVHHIAIICSDYAKSKRFYTEVLGLKIVREVYREQRQSYKLDLEVATSTRSSFFLFPILPHVPHAPKRLVCVI